MSDPEESAGASILLVEDEVVLRLLTARILERAGHRVRIAGSAEEAERLLSNSLEPPRLLITDVVLPGERGVDLAQRWIARWPQLRVLFLSGYTDDPHFRAKVEARGQFFLEKPYSTPDLLAIVGAALAGR